ncbi:MAG: hypothetical protein HY787_11670 [Deltaproteobacteria bacterium]|nr:hypothetical protein [Deltaproteobacteria bacterium]
MIPSRLYHYFEKSREPFLSITETPEINARVIVDKIGQSPIRFNRFDTPQKREFYSFFRNYTEKKIKTMFVEKGGKPSLEFPRYMTLGPANIFYYWYEETGIIEIPLEEFDEEVISFTYPDSMMTLMLAENQYEALSLFHISKIERYKRPHHGKVFTKSELQNVIKKYGLPDKSDPQKNHPGNRMIEAQIWDLEVIERYVQAIT